MEPANAPQSCPTNREVRPSKLIGSTVKTQEARPIQTATLHPISLSAHFAYSNEGGSDLAKPNAYSAGAVQHMCGHTSWSTTGNYPAVATVSLAASAAQVS